MVLGHGCTEHYKLTERNLALAKRIISRMKFIGLSDEWNRSICLFHKQFGGNLNINELKVDEKEDTEENALDDKILFDGSDNDRFDEELYHHVQTIVYERFELYGC